MSQQKASTMHSASSELILQKATIFYSFCFCNDPQEGQIASRIAVPAEGPTGAVLSSPRSAALLPLPCSHLWSGLSVHKWQE